MRDTVSEVVRGPRADAPPELRRRTNRNRGASNPVLGTPTRGVRTGATTRGRGHVGPAFGNPDLGRFRPRHGGHYEMRKVWVPGRIRRVHVPAEYEYRWDPYCRQYVRVCVREAYYTTVRDPGHWEYRRVRVKHRHRHGGRRGIHIHF